MNSASRLSLLRAATVFISTLPAIALGALLYLVLEPSGAPAVAFSVLLVLVVAFAGLWIVFSWPVRCPACKEKGAKFVWRGDLEHLECSKCGYDELTGAIDK